MSDSSDTTKIIISTSQSVQEINKLAKALQGLNKQADAFEKGFFTKITTGLSEFSQNFQKVTSDLNKVTNGIDQFVSSIGMSFSKLTDQTIKSGGKVLSAFDALSNITKEFVQIGQLDSTGDFHKLQASFNKLGKGLTDLNNLSIELKLDQTIPKQLSDFVNLFRYTDTELSKIGNKSKSDSGDSSQGFVRSSVKLVNSLSDGCASLNKQFQGLSTNVKKFPKKSDIKSVVGNIKDLVAKGGLIGSFAIKEVPTTSGSVKKVKTYINENFTYFVELTNIIKKFSSSLSTIKSFSGVTSDDITQVNDRIKELVDQSSQIGGFEIKSTNDGGKTKQVKTYIYKNFTYFVELTNIIKKFSSSLSTIKSFSKFSAEDMLQFNGNLQDIIDFSSSFGEFVDIPETNNGKTSVVRSYIYENFTYFVELTNIIKKFSSSLSTIKSFSGVTSDDITQVNDRIKELVDQSSQIGGFEIKSTNDGDKTKQVKTYIYKNFTYFIDLANILSKFGSSLNAIKSFSKVTPETVTEVKSKLKSLIDDIQDFSSFNIDSNTGDSNKGQVKEYMYKNFAYFTNLSNVLGKFSGSLNSVKSFAKVTERELGNVCESISLLIGTLSEFGKTTTKKVTDQKTGKTKEVAEYVYEEVKQFHVLSNVLKQFGSGLNAIYNFSKFKTLNLDNIKGSITTIIDDLSATVDRQSFSKFERLAIAMDKVSTAAKNLSSKTKKVNKVLEDQNKTIGIGQRLFGKFSPVVRQFFTAFAGYNVIYSTVRAIQASIRSLTDIEYFMARVNTIARASQSTLSQWTDRVLKLSAQYGLSKNDITKALYDINSATIVGADAFYVLEASAKQAIAGYTDISKTSELLSRIINAYGYSAKSASRLSDVLFKTVERGINPMEELSQYLGRVLTIASNSSVQFEEITAAVATMTTRGYQTNIAITALNSALLKLAQSPDKLNELFREYGYLTSAAALRTGGLTEALRVLQQATGGSTEKLRKLGFDTRDIRAVTLLASEQFSEFTNNLDQMKNSEGATDQAVKTQADTLQVKWNRLKQSVETLFITFNRVFNIDTGLKNLVHSLTNIVRKITQFIEGSNNLGSQIKFVCTVLLQMRIRTLALTTSFGKLFFNMTSFKQGLRLLRVSFSAQTTQVGVFKGSLLSLRQQFTQVKIGAYTSRIALEAFKASVTLGLSLLITLATEVLARFILFKDEMSDTDTFVPKIEIKQMQDHLNELSESTQELRKDLSNLEINYKDQSIFDTEYFTKLLDMSKTFQDALNNQINSVKDLANAGDMYAQSILPALKDELSLIKSIVRERERMLTLSKQMGNILDNLKSAGSAYSNLFSKDIEYLQYLDAISDFTTAMKELDTVGIKFSADTSLMEEQLKSAFAKYDDSKIKKQQDEVNYLQSIVDIISEDAKSVSGQVLFDPNQKLGDAEGNILMYQTVHDIEKNKRLKEIAQTKTLDEWVNSLKKQKETLTSLKNSQSVFVDTLKKQASSQALQQEHLNELSPKVNSFFSEMADLQPKLPAEELLTFYQKQIDKISSEFISIDTSELNREFYFGDLYTKFQDELSTGVLQGLNFKEITEKFLSNFGITDKDTIGKLFTSFGELQKLQKLYNQTLHDLPKDEQKDTSQYKIPQSIQVSQAVASGSKEAFDMLIKQVFPERTVEEDLLKSNRDIYSDTSKIQGYVRQIAQKQSITKSGIQVVVL